MQLWAIVSPDGDGVETDADVRRRVILAAARRGSAVGVETGGPPVDLQEAIYHR